MNGYDRLKDLYKKNQHQDAPLIHIMKHLLKQPDMSELYQKEEKSLEQMMEFVNGKAKESAFNNVAVIEDAKVYEWATEYFSKSNEELGLNDKKAATKPKPVKEDKPKDDNQLSLGV